MGQWVVSVLSLEPLHLRVTPAPAAGPVTGIFYLTPGAAPKRPVNRRHTAGAGKVHHSPAQTMTGVWVPKTPVTLCDLGIFMDQAAEPVPAQNPDACAQSGRMRAPGRRGLLQRPVRAMQVVMSDVLAHDQPQVPFAGDQHPVQAFAAGAGEPAFRDRVRPRRLLDRPS